MLYDLHYFVHLLIFFLTTSEDSDYVGLSNIAINFFAGDQNLARRCTTLTINEDSIVEYNETFNVVLTENSDQLQIQTGRNVTEITIWEDDDCEFL